jgi:conjugative transfer region lipoprotein (TIGR03751 family)
MKRKITRTAIYWISFSGVILASSGCSSMITTRVPKGAMSMKSVYDQAINGHGETSLEALRQRTLTSSPPNKAPYFVLRADTKSVTQFSRLSNPDIPLYIYPHIAGGKNTGVPVPGYYTRFPLYTHVYYH